MKGWPKKIEEQLYIDDIYKFDDSVTKTSSIEYCGQLRLYKLSKITRTDFVKECNMLDVYDCDKIRDFKHSPKGINELWCRCQHQIPMSFEGLPKNLDKLFIEHIKIPHSNLKNIPSSLKELKFMYVHDKEWYTEEEFKKYFPNTKINER